MGRCGNGTNGDLDAGATIVASLLALRRVEALVEVGEHQLATALKFVLRVRDHLQQLLLLGRLARLCGTRRGVGSEVVL